MLDHIVQQGECLSSIAKLYGFPWLVIWDHPSNSDLKQQRQDPNVLFPGDVVHVPEKEIQYYPRPTDARHKFRLEGSQTKLRVKLMRDDQPRANEAYSLQIDGKLYTGQTDGSGWLEQQIPADARAGKLVLSDGVENYPVYLGHLDPVDETSGAAARLSNLGFYRGAVSSDMGPELEAALRAFQQKMGLPESGQPDSGTVAALKQQHTS